MRKLITRALYRMWLPVLWAFQGGDVPDEDRVAGSIMPFLTSFSRTWPVWCYLAGALAAGLSGTVFAGVDAGIMGGMMYVYMYRVYRWARCASCRRGYRRERRPGNEGAKFISCRFCGMNNRSAE